MTIAIALKVNDGVELAADSATSLPVQDQFGHTSISRVYNNANKLFCLHKGLPLGALTWGLGNVGPITVALLMKDLRSRLMGTVQGYETWKLDISSYTVEEVARKLFQYVYQEKFLSVHYNPSQQDVRMGFFVAGYSAGQDIVELFTVEIDRFGYCTGPQLLSSGNDGGFLAWNGQPEAIQRLVFGIDMRLASVLQIDLGVDPGNVPAVMNVLRERLNVQLWSDAMPIQDAIDLIDFLADVSAKFSRFTAGAVTVGGPIELAAITRYEHFKWIRRKHYFDRVLNPEEVP